MGKKLGCGMVGTKVWTVWICQEVPVKMHSSQNAVCQDVWSTPVLTGFLALTEVGCQPGSRGLPFENTVGELFAGWCMCNW